MFAQFLMSAPSIHHHLSLCPSAGPPNAPPPPLCCPSDRAVASVLQGGCPGEQLRGEEALGMHQQHYAARATNLREFPFSLLFFCSVCFAYQARSYFKKLRPLALLSEQHREVWMGQQKALF